MSSSVLGRVLVGVAGLGMAYLTVVLIAWTSFTTADSPGEYVADSIPFLLASAVTGIAAAWLLLTAVFTRRPWLAVLVVGLAPAVLTLLSAPLRY
jgi:hypothetical protein